MNPLAIIFSFVFGVCFAGLLGWTFAKKHVRLLRDDPLSVAEGVARGLSDAHLLGVANIVSREMGKRALALSPSSEPNVPEVSL